MWYSKKNKFLLCLLSFLQFLLYSGGGIMACEKIDLDEIHKIIVANEYKWRESLEKEDVKFDTSQIITMVDQGGYYESSEGIILNNKALGKVIEIFFVKQFAGYYKVFTIVLKNNGNEIFFSDWHLEVIQNDMVEDM
jgi:hypothetical protein